MPRLTWWNPTPEHVFVLDLESLHSKEHGPLYSSSSPLFGGSTLASFGDKKESPTPGQFEWFNNRMVGWSECISLPLDEREGNLQSEDLALT